MSKEAMKLALDHSEPSILSPGWTLVRNEDIAALREALAEPDFWQGYVPEPVGVVGSSIKSESPLGCNGPTGPAQQEPVCAWQREDDDHMPGTWRSDCGVLWTFTDGSPVDNQMKYCCGCGAMLLEKNT